MKKVLKRLISALLVFVMLVTILPFGMIAAHAVDYEYALFPMSTLRMNWPDDINSVTNHNGRGYIALDVCGTGTGIDDVFAPFTGTIVAIDNNWHAVYLQSDNPVRYADGSVDFMTVLFVHDDNISNLHKWDSIKQGETFYQEGGFGDGKYDKYPKHLHMEVIRGKYYGGDAFGVWDVRANQNMLPNNALYIKKNTNMLYAGGISWKTVPISDYEKPGVPDVKLSTPTHIPTGSNATAYWNAVSGKPTPTYTAELFNGGNVLISTKSVNTGTNVGFPVPSAGSYYIKVTASNSVGSNSGKSGSFIAHDPSTVTFKDWDGKILNTQLVNYGASAIAPPTPSRDGYDFTIWDKSFLYVISDLMVNATYQIKRYTIKFTDMYGNILKTQVVDHGADATPPSETNPPNGYVFVDWGNKDFINVRKNATIPARYKWGNTNLPVIATITSASRQPDGYYVYFNLTNYPTAITRGRAVVTLKTAEGKLVDATESAAFSIPASGTKTGIEVFVPCDKAATTLEVLIVNSYSSGVPISLKKTTSVNQDGMWSNWQDTNPTGTGLTIESRTEYRYHDKEYSTATSRTKAGWTLYNTTSSTGNWSAWSDGQYSAFENEQQKREIQTQTVVAQDFYKTQYNYSRWYGHNGSYWVAWPYQSGSCQSYQEKGWSDSALASSHDCDVYDVIQYGTPDPTNTYNTADPNKLFWYNQWTQSVYSYSTYKTQWQYRDTFFTYYFYRWPTTWSAWSPTQVTANNDRQVETKTTYRYKSTAAASEDNTGVSRTLSGIVDIGFAGKQASIFIYKVDEASDFTNEFVGQTTIAADGSYSFTYKLREEPSIKTGDFTIALGIEGTTNTIVIDKIEAPKPIYTVEFYDYNGSIVSTQQVEQGSAAVLPANPTRAGYTFIGWDTGITNIRDNMEINARYIVNVYTVVFIDWTNDTVETRSFNYGDVLTGPLPEVKEGYDFIGWDALLGGTTTVTDNMILTATHEKKTYEVKFFDFDMNVISSQSVPYGESANVPDDLTKENYIFLGWQAPADIACVKQNLEIMPKFIYDETVATPTANIESGVYSEDQTVTLSCETIGASIYYSLDGTDPTDGSDKYSIPITISRGTELKFVAKASVMNDSEVVSKQYAINKSNMVSKWMPYSELPSFVTDNPAEFNVISGTGHKYKDVQTTHFITTATGLETAGWSNDGFVYGEFTEWSTTQPNEPNAYIDTEVKDPDPVDTPFYRYSHWKYFDDTTQTYVISRVEVAGKTGQWEYTTLPNPLTVQGFDQGNPRYTYGGENWYSQSIVIIGVVPDYKLYRYRYKEYSFSKWTDWSIAEIASGETRETQTDTVFQFTGPTKYLQTVFYDDGPNTQLVTANKLITFNLSEWQINGYTFNGFFTDEACTQPWNLETDVVTGNLTLYPKWTINECLVSFVGFEGSDLGTQTVEYGSAATAPIPAVVENYTFLGWDTVFDNVTTNITVTAQYKFTNDVLKVALNMASNVLTVDSMFRIISDVTPAAAENKTLIWTSSDEEVATVDQTGLVTAISVGIATITATTEVDKQSASCEITVLSNGAWNFNFDQTSNLKFIIGLEAGNKVSDLKAQILNTNIRFVDPAGQEMGEDEIVSTGCKVQMVEAQTLVAEKTFVFYGDVNSDGSTDSIDAGVLVDRENYLISWDPVMAAALYAAADVNGDGTIDSIDAGIVVDTENYLVSIDQSTGLASSN